MCIRDRNAVHVDGEWRLLDVFWASTCLVGRQSADWALLDSDGQLVDSNDVQVKYTSRRASHGFETG